MHDLDHPIQIAKAPWRESEARDAEEGIEDLAVDFEPFLARGIVVVGAGVVHCRGGVEQQEEEHGAPCLHVVSWVLVRGGYGKVTGLTTMLRK